MGVFGLGNCRQTVLFSTTTHRIGYNTVRPAHISLIAARRVLFVAAGHGG